MSEPSGQPAPRPTSDAALSLSVSAATAAQHAFVPALRRRLRAAHAILSPALIDLSVALVGDKRMGGLHARFMGIPGPTDVLTFPLDADRRGRVTAGEVVVCVPEARRRAREHGVPVEHELLLYALHGMLHLCGYDDRTDRAYSTMHRKEDEILRQLGVGPVFAWVPAGRPRPAAAAAEARPSAAGRSTGRRSRRTTAATGARR